MPLGSISIATTQRCQYVLSALPWILTFSCEQRALYGHENNDAAFGVDLAYLAHLSARDSGLLKSKLLVSTNFASLLNDCRCLESQAWIAGVGCRMFGWIEMTGEVVV